jgi:rubrerythrin
MAEKDVKEIVATLGLMTEAEKALSRFYLQCAEKLPDDRAFWEKLSAEEGSHADSIARMAGFVIETMGAGFEANRAFNRVSIHTFMKGVESNLEALKKGALAGRRIYYAVRDTEQALLETRYGDVVRTADPRYNALIKQVIQETQAHFTALQEKIASLD